jgi:hypothetical protein
MTPISPDCFPMWRTTRAGVPARSTRRRRAGRILRLPPGSFVVSNIDLPDGARIIGVPGATRLIYGGRGHGMLAEGARRIELSGLDLDGANQRLGGHVTGADASARRQRGGSRGHGIAGADRHGLTLEACGGRIQPLEISGARLAGIYAVESRGLSITATWCATAPMAASWCIAGRWARTRPLSRATG